VANWTDGPAAEHYPRVQASCIERAEGIEFGQKKGGPLQYENKQQRARGARIRALAAWTSCPVGNWEASAFPQPQRSYNLPSLPPLFEVHFSGNPKLHTARTVPVENCPPALEVPTIGLNASDIGTEEVR